MSVRSCAPANSSLKFVPYVNRYFMDKTNTEFLYRDLRGTHIIGLN